MSEESCRGGNKGRTVSGYVVHGVDGGDVPTWLADDDAELDCIRRKAGRGSGKAGGELQFVSSSSSPLPVPWYTRLRPWCLRRTAGENDGVRTDLHGGR